MIQSQIFTREIDRHCCCLLLIQLADAVSKYGRGEHKEVFDILGPDFDGLSYKVGPLNLVFPDKLIMNLLLLSITNDTIR